MSAELKPCPFCGGKADRMREWSGRMSTMICCVDATCIGHHYEQYEQGGWNHAQSLDENIAAWNRRVADADAARLSLRDTFIAEKGLWSEFAETVLHQQSSLEAIGE